MAKIKRLRRRIPGFPRVGHKRTHKIGESWRKAKGHHGRPKKQLSYHKGASPDVGYGLSKSIRGKHTSGLKIILISNLKELDKIDAKTQIAKIASVGKKKKIEIVEKAISKKIRICNLRKPEEYLSKNKKETKKEAKK